MECPRPTTKAIATMSAERPDQQPLSDHEWEQFRLLLRRYCAWNLDQWDTWRTATPYGPVYITISRYPEKGATPESYVPLDRDD
jgi:hypothetical protein